MGWSRDLGVCGPEDVGPRLAEATARATGRLSAAEQERLGVLRDALSKGIALAPEGHADIKRLEAVSEPSMSPEEIATVAKATAVLEAALKVHGRAHVHVGGSDRVEMQPEASPGAKRRGDRQTSVSFTLTTTTEGTTDGVAGGEPMGAPKQIVDTSVPWQPGQ